MLTLYLLKLKFFCNIFVLKATRKEVLKKYLGDGTTVVGPAEELEPEDLAEPFEAATVLVTVKIPSSTVTVLGA